MSACEECWERASYYSFIKGGSIVEWYRKLIESEACDSTVGS